MFSSLNALSLNALSTSRCYAPPVVAPARMREPPAEYGPGQWRYYQTDGGHEITRRAERQVAAQAPAQVEALLALADRFRRVLDDETRTHWLELEEALHAYWSQVSIAHYELGVEAGLRRSLTSIGAGLPRRARLEAIAQALQLLARELPE